MGGGQPLGPVALRERDEVGDLLPLQVNDLHQLARPGGKGRTVPARNLELPPHKIRPRRFGRCPRRAVCLPGHHGSFITHGEDCASYIILGSSRLAQIDGRTPPARSAAHDQIAVGEAWRLTPRSGLTPGPRTPGPGRLLDERALT